MQWISMKLVSYSLESCLNTEHLVKVEHFLRNTYHEQGFNNIINDFLEEPYLEQETLTEL